MKFPFFQTLHHYKLKYLPSDLFAGIIVAAISIPISMGYAQVCGLPAIYGLYGSVLPPLLFAMFSTSPQFIFGVDAAPCAVVGGTLATMGITAASEDAVTMVAGITFFAALWLILFAILKAGRLVNFISVPVMGGFISGIAAEIILMQLPKVFGAPVGKGELVELLTCLWEAVTNIHWLSFGIGALTIALILSFKKFLPKFPMAILVMAMGAAATAIFDLGGMGVKLLDSVEPGLPPIRFFTIDVSHLGEIIGTSLTIAVIILAETLLATNNFAMKNGYKIQDNREILTYGICNLFCAFTGCTPVNGSVSRTAMGEQFGGKTQLTSLIAGIAMVGVLLFGTGFIGFLPVPVLTGIVISALCGVVELHLLIKLIKTSLPDVLIFLAAFFGVLVLGTIYGVIIGIILSFVAVVLRAAKPERCFLGIIPGKEGFFNRKRNRRAQPIAGAVIYRFSSNLFFANIKTFQEDLENCVKEDTKVVIVDASSITSIDTTAAERLEVICKWMEDRGIKFYITEHIGRLNDQFRKLGLERLIHDGIVRRTIHLALINAGYRQPYPMEETGKTVVLKDSDSLHEYEWAYGKDADTMMAQAVQQVIDTAQETGQAPQPEQVHADVDLMIRRNTIMEDELLVRLETRVEELSEATGQSEEAILAQLEDRREKISRHLQRKNEKHYQLLRQHRQELAKHLERDDPDAYRKIIKLRSKKNETK